VATIFVRDKNSEKWNSRRKEKRRSGNSLDWRNVGNRKIFFAYETITRCCLRHEMEKTRVTDKMKFATRTIDLSEFNDSKEKLIKAVKQQYFSYEINCLKQSNNVFSKLLFWWSWIDKNNVLRVGCKFTSNCILYTVFWFALRLV